MTVEALAGPCPDEPGERPERVSHIREWIMDRVEDRRQRLEYELGFQFHNCPLGGTMGGVPMAPGLTDTTLGLT